ncbi:MAG: carboxypeptidase-like regulatory domain-containing protein [bacterium]|nr:carboxypeptidase-like regulatory domain-containing protein [bacterium]
MMYSSYFQLALILGIFKSGFFFGQELSSVSGTVVVAASGQQIPYASLGIKKQLIGIVTNEDGKFELKLPADSENDTLVVIAFGYEHSKTAINSIRGHMILSLISAPIQLQEVDVIPLSPEQHIRMAMRKTAQNYPSASFESLAYYREKLLENKEFIKMDEGIFKTFCPNYLDTVKNQDQLLLYRTAENTKAVSFMSKESKKNSNDEKDGEKVEGKHVDLDLTSSFGGPEEIFKSSRINPKTSSFLDTLQLHDYRYSFAASGYEDFMVIEFNSKGKVDHVRESGRIFIDRGSFAIVKIEENGDFIIPILIRPVLFLYGLGIENPSFVKHVEFQQVKGKWYPSYIHYSINLNLTRRHLFSRNEHALFEIEQIYAVNRLIVDNPKTIDSEKRFQSSKKMKDQLFNDENLNWETVNIIQR